ncbi:unnamed protein product [Adineta ricciae]|uniref:Uncharacterized protein n=1 Tax=Adineta ricciae TaxID=249248 RepID=A0A816GM72_ADIRI|nr:unnamed protein product [Adineta ricciae]
MSLLVKLKNKLQDPILYEMKIREFDECMLLLRNENAELHKRIDQLEALCRANVNTQRTYVLDERIGELEEENGRLFAENQCQRQEYVQFLDQLSTMVIRTAVMQENIRKECASIYHVIGKLSSLTTNATQSNHLSEMVMKERKTLAIDNQVLHSSSSSSSSFDSWTFDRVSLKSIPVQ